ncbi:MAG: PQQ-binding-like beta-propeller repeat protein [Deltaproteobacteria bacterium]|nr:MAG: PQQ-binding-like beta-propeller repeat protein [Deltaproteobacteria bacterium]
MARQGEDQKEWQAQVKALGFRETAIGYLRDRLYLEYEKNRADSLIRRLSKYEPQQEIVKLLCQNPVWQQRAEELIRELPEVTADPQVQFVFMGAGNVPKVPVLEENKLYFGCGDTFYGLNGQTGEVIWKVSAAGENWSAAHFSGHSVYVSSPGRLHSISPDNGSERWHHAVDKRLGSPYTHQDRVFVGSAEGTLYAVDAEKGQRLWTFNVVKAISVASGVWQNKVYAASKDHSLYALDMDDGECLWHFTTGAKIYGTPYVSDGVVYLTSADHKVYALFAASGQVLWSFTTGSEIHTSPFEQDGLVFVSSRDKHLYVLDAENGKELWRHKTLGYPSSPTACRGMLYFSVQGRVYGIALADHKMRWCFPFGFSHATAPVAGQRRIYVGTLEGKLVCLRLKTELDEQGATQVLKEFLDPEPEDA